MPERPSPIESVPSARRLVDSLRDVGYDFPSAVADLVDNSIAAAATRVDIQCHWEEQDSWVRVTDNGTGMNGATLTEALRFGADRGYEVDDLGKFGLGLKTASLSQCREFSVASRISKRAARIEARRFSLNRILEEDRWEIENLPPSYRPDELVDPLLSCPGTTVLWSDLDRMLSSRVLRGKQAKESWFKLLEQLEFHLGMVFHRFIEGDLGSSKRRRVKITVNGNVVPPWNPFAPAEQATQHLQPLELNVTGAGHSGVVFYDPYILPPKDKFSSEEEFKRLSGPNSWNQQQGFYIYRANRMIQSGGWSRTRAPDEHTKLARVAIDFFPELDDAFGINISKVGVQLPQSLREQLKQPIETLIKEAKKAYNPRTSGKGRARKKVDAASDSVDLAPSPKPKVNPPQITPTREEDAVAPLSWPPPLLVDHNRPPPAVALEKAASAVGHESELADIRARLLLDEPEAAHDIGW